MKKWLASALLVVSGIGFADIAQADEPAVDNTQAKEAVAQAEPCESGATVRVRYNRPMPCDPNSSNTVNVWWPKNWGANHVQNLCAEMGGTYVAGPRARNCYDVDVTSLAAGQTVSAGFAAPAAFGGLCASATPVLQKHNGTAPCNYDGDNVVIFWWPQNYGETFVRGECGDIGGKYVRARASRAMHFCVDIDF